MSESAKEEAQVQAFAIETQKWDTIKLGIVVSGVVLIALIMIPITYILAGTVTIFNLSVNVAVAYSVATTATAGVALVGWKRTRTGQLAAEERSRALHDRNTELRATIKQLEESQPRLMPEEDER